MRLRGGVLGVLLALAAAAPAAHAQINGRMGAGREFGQRADDPLLSEPRPVNVVSVLVAHRAALALTDSQFTQLVTLRRSLDSLNFPLFRRLDSLQRVEHQASSAFRRIPPDTLRTIYDLAHATLNALSANMQPATDQAHNLLDERQLALAAQYESQARDEAAAKARDAANPRRGLFPFAKPPA